MVTRRFCPECKAEMNGYANATSPRWECPTCRLTLPFAPNRRALVELTDWRFADGRPAVVTGARETFAHVRTLDGAIDHTYAWHTVQRYADSGKAFPVA